MLIIIFEKWWRAGEALNANKFEINPNIKPTQSYIISPFTKTKTLFFLSFSPNSKHTQRERESWSNGNISASEATMRRLQRESTLLPRLYRWFQLPLGLWLERPLRPHSSWAPLQVIQFPQFISTRGRVRTVLTSKHVDIICFLEVRNNCFFTLN